jgi:hypothetical protein
LVVGALAAATALVVHSLFDFNLRVAVECSAVRVLLGLASAPTRMLRFQAPPATLARGGLPDDLGCDRRWRAVGARAFRRIPCRRDPNARIESSTGRLGGTPIWLRPGAPRGGWRDWWERDRARARRLARSLDDLTPRFACVLQAPRSGPTSVGSGDGVEI